MYIYKKGKVINESFARHACTDARVLKRSCESLLGICSGILADGIISNEEIRFLDLWLSDNKNITSTWPGEVIYSRIQKVLADNIITEKERDHLKQTLTELIGGTLQETGSAGGLSTSLPIDDIDRIEIKNNIFCFTGNFLYGTRKACERAISDKGGIAIPRIRMDLNYLVIGTMSSREWAHTSHGRKIEKAMEFKKNNCPILIVSEKQWIKYL